MVLRQSRRARTPKGIGEPYGSPGWNEEVSDLQSAFHRKGEYLQYINSGHYLRDKLDIQFSVFGEDVWFKTIKEARQWLASR